MKQKGAAPLILILILFVIGIGGAYYFGTLKNKTPELTKEAEPKATLPPTPEKTTEPAVNPTADWKNYSNSEINYSIKYPPNFRTEEISYAVSHEATSTSRNFIVYKLDSKSPYEDRYISFEVIELEPTYNQGTITQTTLNGYSVKKIILNSMPFDIYSVKTKNNLFIEIYVSNDPLKKDVANQILSTFKFTQ